MSTISVSPETATGVARSVVVESPTCPSPFAPQHMTWPEERTAHAWYSPTARAVASAMPETATGVVCHP
jgi:hypothetical protein